jgi:hypothetical protein
MLISSGAAQKNMSINGRLKDCSVKMTFYWAACLQICGDCRFRRHDGCAISGFNLDYRLVSGSGIGG